MREREGERGEGWERHRDKGYIERETGEKGEDLESLEGCWSL